LAFGFFTPEESSVFYYAHSHAKHIENLKKMQSNVTIYEFLAQRINKTSLKFIDLE
jgi:hypothetical protein